MKVHYLVTCIALIFLGVVVTHPRSLSSPTVPERSCKMVKGKMDCISKFSEYKINKNTEVQYKLN